ncbi:MAG: YndJ family transporter [Myxococcales bacterium]|nr:YndJ family transporter [Myxococcales bacterium]
MEASRISRHSAVIGTALWIGWQLLVNATAPAVLFALSPLVLVPLLLRPLLDQDQDPSRLLRVLSWSQLACALTLPMGLSLRPGPVAMISCLPWTAWTALAAIEALQRLRRLVAIHGWLELPRAAAGELAIAAGLGFPIIGSAWLLADRLDLQPLGFSPLIVALTAAHFHHAGFTLPLCAGYLTRWRPQQQRWRVAAFAIVLAVPLVAIGITVSPLLELISAWLTAAAAMTVGVGMLLRARELTLISALASALSGAAILAAMLFAGSYALTEYLGVPLPDIVAMIQLHGAVNALGFGLLGAWSWHLSPPPAPAAKDGVSS